VAQARGGLHKPLAGGGLTQPDTPYYYPGNWTLDLNEHFASLDAWTKYDNDPYQDTIRMASQVSLRANGGLRITGSDELIGGLYQGGLAYSNAFYSYGYFECYCKLPPGYVWPAFFLYDSRRESEGAIKNEIDVFEWLGTNTIYVTTHIDTDSWGLQCDSIDLSAAYHKWGLYWDESQIIVYLDDKQIIKTTVGIPQVSMNIMFSLYLDGMAPPPTNVTFPCNYDIDYVKVWTKAA
jgi:hypothetical protein